MTPRRSLTQILRSGMTRPTKYPEVIELRPRGIFSDHRARLKRLINTFLASYPNVPCELSQRFLMFARAVGGCSTTAKRSGGAQA